MAAALGHLLVFEVNAGGAGGLEEPDGALDVQGLAEAGVGVAEERQGGRLGDERACVDELGQREEADVGHAEPGRQGAAGEVDGLEAEPLGQPGDQRR